MTMTTMVEKNRSAIAIPRFWVDVRRLSFGFVLAVVLLLPFAACSPAHVDSVTSLQASDKLRPGIYQEGMATWYGHPFHGCPTASGELYDMYGLSAAHKELPLGTRIRVTNLDNGRSLDVRVNDRGPFVKNRILDLSFGAARRLGLVGPGTARVRIEILELPRSFSHSQAHPFAIQFGAYTDRTTAERLRAKLAQKNPAVFIETVRREDGSLYRVRLGWFRTRVDARREALRLKQYEALVFRR
jgi:rare lipoprotein A